MSWGASASRRCEFQTFRTGETPMLPQIHQYSFMLPAVSTVESRLAPEYDRLDQFTAMRDSIFSQARIPWLSVTESRIMADPTADITRLLSSAARGDSSAARELLPLVYHELHRLAQARMSQTPPGNTLQPTALVHEAYLRLVGAGDPGWNSRGHFFGAAAQAMRNILVDQARRKAAVKHGGQAARVADEPEELAFESPAEDILALDEALQKLEKQDAEAARVVVFKHFAGLSDAEIAASLNISERTVRRDWRFARAWLQHEMGAASRAEERGDGP